MRAGSGERRVAEIGRRAGVALCFPVIVGLGLLGCSSDDDPALTGEVDGPGTSQLETVGPDADVSTGGPSSGTPAVTTDGQPAAPDGQGSDRSTVPTGSQDVDADGDDAGSGPGGATPTTATPGANPPDVSTQP